MTEKIFCPASLAVAAALQPAWCAPPLATDDASTLPPGACQFEIEQRQFHSRVERDMVPVCNVWFDMEIGIGHQRVAPTAAPRADSIVFQFKKVLVPADVSGWSFGLAAATIRATGGESGTRQHYLNALATRQFENTAMHLNLGVVADKEADAGTRKHRLSWGIAVEQDTSDRWTLVGEVFGQLGLPETIQLGLRWWAVPKLMQFTTSLGAQRGAGRDGRWVSFGVRFETGGSIF